jgi:thiaminase (transcriptional activator TenA)
MKFTETLWQEIATVYQATIAHPFNQELMQGTLEKDKFQFYLQQDSLYLVDFARSLALVGARSTHSDRVVRFLQFAEGAIIAERELHESYFQEYGITPTAEKAPGCFTYTNFLLATAALGRYEEAIAALLPCFWIYQEVGISIAQDAAPNNPYQKWIDTYSGEEFAAVVESAIAMTDEVATAITDESRQLMQAAFITSSRLEWLFWDSAYRLEAFNP